MPRFLVLYVGPPTPPGASHEAWPAWFDGLGDGLIERGSPVVRPVKVSADGSTGEAETRVKGYSIIRAQDADEALRLVQDHPILAAGAGYCVEVGLLP